MAPEPLRHYFVARDVYDATASGTCGRDGCARAKSDPVHLAPGDDAAYNAAVTAAMMHPASTRTPEQSEAALARAAQRTARRRARGASESG